MRSAFVVSLLFLLAVSAAYAGLKGPVYIVDNRVDIDAATERWENTIERRGPEEARGVIESEIRLQDPKHRHELAHTMGTALYELGGIPYAAYCSREFIYGCFHQFIGMAMAEHGTAVVPEILDECRAGKEISRFCAHAIGHALVSYYGYGEVNLPTALDACESVHPTRGEVLGCAQGVFMEFNLREILDEANRSIRDFTEAHATEPCIRISGDFQSACAFQLPLWWRQSTLVGSASPEDIYRLSGEWCASFASENVSKSCFAGIGFATTWFENFSAEKIHRYCALAARVPSDALVCVASAAQNARLNKVPVEPVCGVFEGVAKMYCEEFAAGHQDEGLRLPVPH